MVHWPQVISSPQNVLRALLLGSCLAQLFDPEDVRDVLLQNDRLYPQTTQQQDPENHTLFIVTTVKTSSPAQITHTSSIPQDTDLPKLIFCHVLPHRDTVLVECNLYHTCWSVQDVQWDLSYMQEVSASGTATTIYSLIPQPYGSSKHLHLLHNRCRVLFALSLIFLLSQSGPSTFQPTSELFQSHDSTTWTLSSPTSTTDLQFHTVPSEFWLRSHRSSHWTVCAFRIFCNACMDFSSNITYASNKSMQLTPLQHNWLRILLTWCICECCSILTTNPDCIPEH
jgi:hypothetical protein